MNRNNGNQEQNEEKNRLTQDNKSNANKSEHSDDIKTNTRVISRNTASSVSESRKPFLSDSVITQIKIVINILGVILTILMLYMAYKSMYPWDPVNSSAFVDINEFGNIVYFGKEAEFRNISAKILKYDTRNWAEENKTRSSPVTNTENNYFFSGPPGTGKTLFVKKLVYILDINLKYQKLNTMEKKKFNKLSSEDKKEYMKNIKGHEVDVKFIEPSVINNAYKGATEKMIKSIFDVDKTKLTVIFIDEVDSFFGKRRSQDEDHTRASKNQFLTCLDGGIQDSKSRRIVFIGASNRRDDIDDAFYRRMPFRMEFSAEKSSELIEEIENFLARAVYVSEERLSIISSNIYSLQMPQIVSMLNSYALEYKDGPILDSEDYICNDVVLRVGSSGKQGIFNNNVPPSSQGTCNWAPRKKQAAEIVFL